MIIGQVTLVRKPAVRVIVHGVNAQADIEAYVDTGFTEYLTLPPKVIAYLNLRLERQVTSELADGSFVLLDLYTDVIEWDGIERRVYVISKPGDPLVGMALLHGFRLVMDAVPGGTLTITRILP
jgi:clan AA aspartic protease